MRGDGRRQRLASAPWRSRAGSCPVPAGPPGRERDPLVPSPIWSRGPPSSQLFVFGGVRDTAAGQGHPPPAAPRRLARAVRSGGGGCPGRAIPARGAAARSCRVPVAEELRVEPLMGTGVRRDHLGSALLMRLQLFGFTHPRDGAVPGPADARSQGSPRRSATDSHKGGTGLRKLHAVSSCVHRLLMDALWSL